MLPKHFDPIDDSDLPGSQEPIDPLREPDPTSDRNPGEDPNSLEDPSDEEVNPNPPPPEPLPPPPNK